MPEPCPDDLRTRAVEKAPAGESRRSVAKELRAAASSVIKWARRYFDTGSAGPSRMGTRRALKLAGCRAWILERIKACPAITPAGLQDWLRGRGFAASLASIWRFPRVCGLARKKPAPVAEALSGPGGPAQAGLHRRDLHEDRHVAQARPGPKGRRVRGSVPFGHWGTFCISAVLFCSRRSIAEPDAAADPRIRFAADLAERIIDASERVQALDLRGHQ